MNDMALVLTSEDAKARRNRKLPILGENILSLQARHFKIKKRTERTKRRVKSYGVVWTNVDRPV